jgi:hypothetical protein
MWRALLTRINQATQHSRFWFHSSLTLVWLWFDLSLTLFWLFRITWFIVACSLYICTFIMDSKSINFLIHSVLWRFHHVILSVSNIIKIIKQHNNDPTSAGRSTKLSTHVQVGLHEIQLCLQNCTNILILLIFITHNTRLPRFCFGISFFWMVEIRKINTTSISLWCTDNLIVLPMIFTYRVCGI